MLLFWVLTNLPLNLIAKTTYLDTDSENKILGPFERLHNWLLRWFSEGIAQSIVTLINGVLVIVLGWLLVKIIKFIMRKTISKGLSQNTVAGFTSSVLTAVIYVVYIFAILSAFNVPTESLAAVVAASGLAIGFALQGSLGNIASGLVILIAKPFEVGDFVNIDGVDGTVKEINLATTIVNTPDNHCVTFPNTTVASSNIVNYMKYDLRRLDLSFNISHKYEVDKIKGILDDIVNTYEHASKDVPPTIVVGDFTSSHVTYFLRVWISSKNFWPLRWQMLELAIKKLQEHGVSLEQDKVNVISGEQSINELSKVTESMMKKAPLTPEEQKEVSIRSAKAISKNANK